MVVRRVNERRRRSRATHPLLILAVVAASSFAAALTLPARSQPRQPASDTRIVAEFDTIEIPVPAEFVPAGSRLGQVPFENVRYPAHQVPNGALVSLQGFENAVTITALPARLPLFAENLARDGTPGNPVIDKIPAGMRAITVRVDATTVVEGWAGSGAVIDVLLVESDRTTVVAEQVRILSSERSVQPVAGSMEPAVPSTVTLLVTQEQALAINTATPRGRITFALRSFKDERPWLDRVYTSDRINGKSRNFASAEIKGYMSVKNQRSFALTDGKWIPTEVRPSGFLVGTTAQEQK